MPDEPRRDDGLTPRGVRAYLASLELFGIKLGLEQIHALLDGLGRPDQRYRSIVVAGTNGKGSTAAMIERGLRAAGHRTGRYTSPHLTAIEERVAIDGESISPEAFDQSAERVRLAAERLPLPPSFFEATTALALDAFRAAGVEVAVLEVGLGGRLDATNAVDAEAAVITMIDFDHQQYLGHTIEAIAAEKAGVIKPGSLVVASDNPPAVMAIIEASCQREGATLVPAGDQVTCAFAMEDGHARASIRTPVRGYDSLRIGLAGRHQVGNAVTAIRLLEAVDKRLGLRVDADAIRIGVQEVTWPARLEPGRIDDHLVVIDGAHNPAGAKTLVAFIDETFGRPLPIVFGAMADKDLGGMIDALAPAARAFVCTAPASPRAVNPSALVEIVRAAAPRCPVVAEPDPRRAISRASEWGAPVVVAGSLYLAGEVRAWLS